MKRVNRKITENDVSVDTHYRRQSAEKTVLQAMAYLKDADKKERVKQNLCGYCYYINNVRLAGQAFTSYNCAVCDKEFTHPNTDTYKLCDKCASKYELCKYCGSDIFLILFKEILKFFFKNWRDPFIDLVDLIIVNIKADDVMTK